MPSRSSLRPSHRRARTKSRENVRSPNRDHRAASSSATATASLETHVYSRTALLLSRCLLLHLARSSLLSTRRTLRLSLALRSRPLHAPKHSFWTWLTGRSASMRISGRCLQGAIHAVLSRKRNVQWHRQPRGTTAELCSPMSNSSLISTS